MAVFSSFVHSVRELGDTAVIRHDCALSSLYGPVEVDRPSDKSFFLLGISLVRMLRNVVTVI